jgi:hypothetical protein
MCTWPFDFHVFGSLTKVLRGCRYGLGEDIKAVVVQWFQQQPKEFIAKGIHWVLHHGMLLALIVTL